jgi:hypothetical protein
MYGIGQVTRTLESKKWSEEYRYEKGGLQHIGDLQLKATEHMTRSQYLLM